MPSLVVIGSVVLEEKKMWTVYNADEAADNNDDGQRTNCDQKSPFEPLAQVNLEEGRFVQFCSIFYSCESCLLFNSFIIWRFTNLKKIVFMKHIASRQFCFYIFWILRPSDLSRRFRWLDLESQTLWSGCFCHCITAMVTILLSPLSILASSLVHRHLTVKNPCFRIYVKQ